MDLVQKGYLSIKKRSKTWKTEEEVRHAWMKGLETALHIELDAERAKMDSNYNNVIIEFKAPGLFNGNMNSPKFIEATEGRLLKYIQKIALKQNLPQKNYIGIATDGNHVSFVQVSDDKLECQPLMPFSDITFQMVSDALKSNYRRAITVDNLVDDFGHSSIIGNEIMQLLYGILNQTLYSGENKKVVMLFEEWASLYGQAADLSVQQKKKIDKSLGFTRTESVGKEIPEKLFATHTFYSLLMKIIAAEIVASHGLSSSKSLIYDLLTIDSDDILLLHIKSDLEEGGFFNSVGLHGFVEEAIFSWYLDAAVNKSAKTRICHALRSVLSKLSVYRFDSIGQNDKSRDILRDFYQDLVPEELRKSLGEFYTPDWLVEHTVSKLNYSENDWVSRRVLDPTCGSGSFIIEAITNKKKAAQKLNWSHEQTLDMIISTVWGFDLNPLAVQSSRVNFLISIAELLKKCGGKEIEIPILLADAIYSPAPNPEGDQTEVEYNIGSELSNLKIVLPSELALNRSLLDIVFKLMSEHVDANHEYEKVAKELISNKIINWQQIKLWNECLEYTYNQVLELHRKNWNGIWFRIVRNYFWSATTGKFDAIIGNPPWVRWSNLPEAYRERIKPTCKMYDIFSNSKYHGGNELDISALITYTTSDKWLVQNGYLAFVITQTVFQSPSSQGFRRFKINNNENLVPLCVDDMKAIKPFPDASNKTAVVLFKKTLNEEVKYPIRYNVWRYQPKDMDMSDFSKKSSFNSNNALEDIMKFINIHQMEATPVSKKSNGSPWAIMEVGDFGNYKLLFGASEWVNGRKGITTDLNGVYFVNIIDINKNSGLVKIRTRPAEGRIDIGNKRDYWVESSFLYPLAKGAADISACYFNPKEELYAFVPNKSINRLDLDSSSKSINLRSNARTYKYFFDFKKQLESRSTYRTRMKNAPFFSIYNIGEYTFSPYKVIWAEMTTNFCAAVITSKTHPVLNERVIIPDHKLYFADFNDPYPAYYLCGLLHSEIIKKMVESHIISTNIGDIFKHINLPKFIPDKSEHIELSNLVLKAHNEENIEIRKKLLTIISEEATNIILDEIENRKLMCNSQNV